TPPPEPVVDKEFTVPNPNDTDKNTTPVDPPQSIPLPPFVFPKNI
ncbi:6741_t:CDS:1, partial [Racocetra fulgida]